MTEEWARSQIAGLLLELAAAREQLAAAQRAISAIPQVIEGLTKMFPALLSDPEIVAMLDTIRVPVETIRPRRGKR